MNQNQNINGIDMGAIQKSTRCLNYKSKVITKADISSAEIENDRKNFHDYNKKIQEQDIDDGFSIFVKKLENDFANFQHTKMTINNNRPYSNLSGKKYLDNRDSLISQTSSRISQLWIDNLDKRARPTDPNLPNIQKRYSMASLSSPVIKYRPVSSNVQKRKYRKDNRCLKLLKRLFCIKPNKDELKINHINTNKAVLIKKKTKQNKTKRN